MTAIPPQIIQLTCPNCQTTFRTQLFTLIDVGRQPELKGYLISGQLNVAVCTNCNTPSMFSAPLIYHDPIKQLYLVHFPQQLNARPEDQERFIGEATTLLMRDLPPQAPRGYLLAPRRFLTLNSLVDTILEADGISREVVEAQRKRIDLIGQLVDAYEQGEEHLAQIAEQNRDALDYEFFATLSAFTEASAQSGRDDSAILLQKVRAALVQLTGFDLSSLEEDADPDELPIEAVIDRLSAAAPDELEQEIADVRPAIDYSFFESWTTRIEQAQQAGDHALVTHLTARRALILETVERMDQQAQELFEAGANILREVMNADDPAPLLRAQRENIDEAFLLVLETNIAAAQRAGNEEATERLIHIQKLAIEIVQEGLSPEDRFINELLQAETPQAATKLLRQNPAIVTTAFVKHLNELADQFANDGRKPLSERLRQLGREAGAMLF